MFNVSWHKSTYEKVAEAATAEELYKEHQTLDTTMISFQNKIQIRKKLKVLYPFCSRKQYSKFISDMNKIVRELR